MTEHYPPERDPLDEGSTTQDLGRRVTGVAPRPVPAPAGEWFDQPGAEQHIRLRGRWMMVCGVVVTVLTGAVAIVWDAGLPGEMPLAALLPLQAVGLGGVAMGCLEILARPHRSVEQRCLDRVELVERAMLELVGLMDEDRQQQFYRGAAWTARNEFIAAGGEHARPLNQYRDSVVPFRQRNRG